MIAPLERVKGMKLTPNACVLCSNNPVDEQTGKQQDAIFAPGVDVDWGNSVYICKSCVEIMADLFDRVTVEGFDRLVDENKRLEKAYEKLQKNHDRAEALLARVRDGGSAMKTIKKEKVT